jgi:hypothetical protein
MTKTIEAGGREENWTNSRCSDLKEDESDDRTEILSEVGSVFVVTLSGSGSETLTTEPVRRMSSARDPKSRDLKSPLRTPPRASTSRSMDLGLSCVLKPMNEHNGLCE